MQCWFIDAYRQDNELVIWLKDSEQQNLRIIQPYKKEIYGKPCSTLAAALKRLELPYTKTQRKLLSGKKTNVFAIPIPKLKDFERIVHAIERETRHRVPLYDADVSPEQQFMFVHELHAGCVVTYNTTIQKIEGPSITFSELKMRVHTNQDIRLQTNTPIEWIETDQGNLYGTEQEILEKLSRRIKEINPDVITCKDAFITIPRLAERAEKYDITVPFHRWDPRPLKYRGGKVFNSYGIRTFRDFAVRLNGRFLVDTRSAVGGNSSINGILELCELSGVRFQQVASRSHGAVFQGALVGEMVRANALVPFKQKPVPKPVDLYSFVKQDRAGHTFDAIIGFHQNVVELDFSCLFPALMVQHNISAEKVVENGTQAPGVDVHLDTATKGFVAKTLRRFVQRRRYHKQYPTSLNRQRSEALKSVLVSANGYLRFREFKLGLASTHVALCAYARECLLTAKQIVESHGFRIIHGIVDSVYIQRESFDEQTIKQLCNEIELATGIPVDFEGAFKWIVFLPSLQNTKRPVPTRYYGAFSSGGVKVRGIEARQKSTAPFLKALQEQILAHMSTVQTKQEIIDMIPVCTKHARKVLKRLPLLKPKDIACLVTITKTEYKHDIIQKKLVSQYQQKGRSIIAGQRVRYIHAQEGPVPLEDYNSTLDLAMYQALILRALYAVFIGFGIEKNKLAALLDDERQITLQAFMTSARSVAVQESYPVAHPQVQTVATVDYPKSLVFP